jgi:diguanylate cyclase (GGDEF)-like protein
MQTIPKDARLRELSFLAKLARESQPLLVTVAADDPDRLMYFHLLREGYVNDLAAFSGVSGRAVENGEGLDRRLNRRLHQDYDLLMSGQPIAFRISHKGLVRVSELRQALQTGRDREPFGILFGKRHILPDLAIALTTAAPGTPLSLAYLDANGFKTINDTISHSAGDEALKSYLSVVLMVTEGRGEAYRAGGDEVVVILPNTTTEQARQTIRAVAVQLHNEKMPGGLKLSLSCGIATTTAADAEAAEFLNAADEQQKRAKARSRTSERRPSVIAIKDQVEEVVPVP